jgi:hypothetical protein
MARPNTRTGIVTRRCPSCETTTDRVSVGETFGEHVPEHNDDGSSSTVEAINGRALRSLSRRQEVPTAPATSDESRGWIKPPPRLG